MEQVLKVTVDGIFDWHKDADKLIEESDFSISPSSTKHILKRLRMLDKIQEESESVRRANIWCTDMFNQMKEDYEQTLAENTSLRLQISLMESK